MSEIKRNIDHKSKLELKLQREAFLLYLEREGETPKELIDELRKSNALSIKERLKNIFNSYESAKTIDAVRKNVARVLSKSPVSWENIEEESEEIVGKYLKFLGKKEYKKQLHEGLFEKMNMTFNELLELLQTANASLVSVLVESYLKTNKEFNETENDGKKEVVREIFNAMYENNNDAIAEKIATNLIKYDAGLEVFLENAEKFASKQWAEALMEIVLLTDVAKFYSNIHKFNDQKWVKKLILKGTENKFGSRSFFENFENYVSEEWVEEAVTKALDHIDDESIILQNISKYRNEKWVRQAVLKGVESYRGSFQLFNEFDNYKDEEWVKEAVLKSIGSDGGAISYVKHYKKIGKIDWIRDLALKAMESLEHIDVFLYWYEDFEGEEWLEKAYPIINKKKYSSTNVFFSNYHKYKGQKWTNEIALKAVEDKSGANHFLKNYKLYLDESWFKAVALKATEQENGANTFLLNYEKYKDQEWAREASLRAVRTHNGALQIFHHADKYISEDWYEEAIYEAVANAGSGALFMYYRKIKHNKWAKEASLKAAEQPGGSKELFNNYMSYKNEEWLKEAALKAVKQVEGGNSFFRNYPKYKEEDWTLEVLDYLLENGVLVKSILGQIEAIPEKHLEALKAKHPINGYISEVGINSTHLYKRYAQYKHEKNELKMRALLDEVNEYKGNLISHGTDDDSIKECEYYQDVMEHVYPSHSINWTNFESNESCEDRSSDLEDFKIREKYEIDLRAGVEMELHPDEQADVNVLSKIIKPISIVQRKYETVNFDKEKMLNILDEDIEKLMVSMENGNVFKTREEKIYALILESFVGNIEPVKLREILIGYQFAEFQDIQEYLQGTQEQTKQAKNPKYAYLLYLREYFADHLKDVQRKIVQEAHENEDIMKLLPDYYKKKTKKTSEVNMKSTLDKMQIDKIGWDGGLYDRIARILDKKTKKRWRETKDVNPDNKKEMKEYETNLKTMFGMIWGEQQKAAKVLQMVTGEKVDPKSVDLGEMNFEEYVDIANKLQSGEYDETLFSKYLLQVFQEIFDEEITAIDREVAKYRPKKEELRGKQRRQLECIITKNKTSAHARQVGGVCVSGDNPMNIKKKKRSDDQCQWNMDNYFQMVFRDKENKVCQGLNLLHYYQIRGEKILAVSMNPSSTYLYKVDERQFFEEIVNKLSEFANDNGIDKIVMSKNEAIRTNRTGGEFESAIKSRISAQNEEYEFDEPQRFSYSPEYMLKKCDVIWKRK